MRYQYWDVLLFPEDSHVPVQEFHTRCYVGGSSDGGKLPTLTCFVPSLKQGTPFRISIHSWEKPTVCVTPSKTVSTVDLLDGYMTFGFEVTVDGHSTANAMYGPETVWPQQIENSQGRDVIGKLEPLRFPLFHTEILRQSHFNASETFGRIRVTLTERLDHADGTSSACKDLVCFSFHHAPQNILEQTGIAWPHPGLWAPINCSTYQFPNASAQSHSYASHAQTPSHAIGGGVQDAAHVKKTPFPRGSGLSDPFAEPRASTTDLWAPRKPAVAAMCMADYTLPSARLGPHPRNGSATGHGGRQVPLVFHVPENRVDHIIQALSSPTKTVMPVSHGSGAGASSAFVNVSANEEVRGLTDSVATTLSMEPATGTHLSAFMTHELFPPVLGSRKTLGNSDASIIPPASVPSSGRRGDMDMDALSPLAAIHAGKENGTARSPSPDAMDTAGRAAAGSPVKQGALRTPISNRIVSGEKRKGDALEARDANASDDSRSPSRKITRGRKGRPVTRSTAHN